jgi:hypothetical protein
MSSGFPFVKGSQSNIRIEESEFEQLLLQTKNCLYSGGLVIDTTCAWFFNRVVPDPST